MDREFSTDNQNTGSWTRRVSINGLTRSVLNHYSHVIANKKLRVETDLTHIAANVNQRCITNAVCRLIENAIEQSPRGGEVNITLVASACQWELEVADSAIDSPIDTTLGNLAETLLGEVEHIAKLHGGLVKTFSCPQGGTANALVIPHNSTTIRSA